MLKTERELTPIPQDDFATLSLEQRLMTIYQRLFHQYGPQHWWPGETPFEMIVGAILTQSTSWSNVEKAIANLKKAGVLDPASLREMPLEELSRLVYSAGYYRAKAMKLRAFVERLGQAHRDSLAKLFTLDIHNLRSELLSIYGIGDETADSIILYAGGKPVFVIDAYTRRIVDRVGIPVEGKDYRHYQQLFMDNLPHDERLFNEYHALLVRHGKQVCKQKPLVQQCCLRDICRYARAELPKNPSRR